MKSVFFAVFMVVTLRASSGVTGPLHKPTRYLLIEHIGIIDKPIPTVALIEGIGYSTSVLKAGYYKFTIPEALYNKSAFIVRHATSSKQTYEFGNFKISIADRAKKTTYFISREEAVNLFSKLHALYTKEAVTSKLPLMMEELKTRIYY